jgi:hypothetical protein
MNQEAVRELMEAAQKKRQALKAEVKELLATKEMLDEDGYPTNDCLRVIEIWDWQDPRGWFEFIKQYWHLASWGWGERDDKHDYRDCQVHLYNISTAGWSGNELIIGAMMKNNMLWNDCWVQSRRGGHYIFEVDEQ